MKSELFAVRPATYDDIAFIHTSWLHHLRTYKPHHIPTTIFYDGAKSMLPVLMNRAKGFIAYAIEEPDLIMGCLVGEPGPEAKRYTMVHWAYVKEAFRGSGIARALYESLRESAHHDSRGIVTTYIDSPENIMRIKRKNVLVCPSLAYYVTLGVYGAHPRERDSP